MIKYTALSQIRTAIQQGETNCEQLVADYLKNIEEQKELNVFLEVFETSAFEKAKAVDQKLKEGKAGKLAGMVIAIKDNICYQGHRLSAASKILEGFESLFSATVVERLLAEDSIIIGRLNCDEFAMGSSNENSAYGAVKNPLNTKKVPGGSSGGAAAAVAGGMCLLSLGSDTGGSIRQPASFCGNVGLKPTYGRVSRYGLIAYASSFDQIGPISHNVEDAALVMEVMAGKDEFDSTSSSKDVPAYSQLLADKEEPKKIAYVKSYVEHEGLDPKIRMATLDLIEQLRSAGHTVEEVEFPFLDHMVPIYYVLTTAEASSNLARFDGVHYGYRSEEAVDLPSTYKRSRTEGFGEEVKRRIMLGTYVLSAGYYDAYYAKAQKVRRLVRDKTAEILEKYDFILSPTTPHTAFDIGAQTDDPIKMYLEDIYTVQAPLSGIPAISLPMGNGEDNMPYGIQLMGAAFSEADLLSFSRLLINNYTLKN